MIGWIVAVVVAAIAGVLGTLLWRSKGGVAPTTGEDPAAARRREEEARAAADAAREKAQLEEKDARRRREEAEDGARREQMAIHGETLDETLERLEFDGGPLPGGPFRDRLRFDPGGGAGSDAGGR